MWAKYAGSLICLILGSAVCWAGLLMGRSTAALGPALSVMALPTLVGSVLLCIAFTLRFWLGEKNAAAALLVLLVSLQLLFVLAFLGSGPAGAARVFMNTVIIPAVGSVSRLPGFLWGALVCAGLLWAGGWISVALYARRDVTRRL
ncbi:MAG: hypothetical protein Q8P50_01600 [Bacillota bacterium]|nr:hypothetical protein [Bacillota bacterium]